MQYINWAPGIGDPTLVGWLTVALYLFCAFGALRLSFHASEYFESNQHKQKQFWFWMFVAMLLLGVNKQLDLQTFFTELGRYFAHKQGWYEYRHKIQKVFIYGVVAGGGVILALIIVVFKSIVKNNVLGIGGFAVVVVFVLIRASSFHYIDIFIHTRFLGLKMNWILELGGLSLIAANIAKVYFAPKKQGASIEN